MAKIGDKMMKCWWVAPAVVLLCCMADIVLMECARGGGVDYAVRYYPLPAVLLAVEAVSALVCISTFTSALRRKRWKPCVVLAVAGVLALSLLVYAVVHDPWGAW